MTGAVDDSIRIPQISSLLDEEIERQYERLLARSRADADAFKAIVTDPQLAGLWQTLTARKGGGDGHFKVPAQPYKGAELLGAEEVQRNAIIETLVQIYIAARTYRQQDERFELLAFQLIQDGFLFRSAKPKPLAEKRAKLLFAAADAYTRVRELELLDFRASRRGTYGRFFHRTFRFCDVRPNREDHQCDNRQVCQRNDRATLDSLG